MTVLQLPFCTSYALPLSCNLRLRSWESFLELALGSLSKLEPMVLVSYLTASWYQPFTKLCLSKSKVRTETYHSCCICLFFNANWNPIHIHLSFSIIIIPKYYSIYFPKLYISSDIYIPHSHQNIKQDNHTTIISDTEHMFWFFCF